MSDIVESAKSEYLRILNEANSRKILPPSATWIVICEAYGIDNVNIKAPKAGMLVCPYCMTKIPYAIKPYDDISICTEWDLHESKDVEKFSTNENWIATESTGMDLCFFTLDDIISMTYRSSNRRKNFQKR